MPVFARSPMSGRQYPGQESPAVDLGAGLVSSSKGPGGGLKATAQLLALLVRALSEKGHAAGRECFKFWEQNRSNCRICDVTMTNYGFADGVCAIIWKKKVFSKHRRPEERESSLSGNHTPHLGFCFWRDLLLSLRNSLCI